MNKSHLRVSAASVLLIAIAACGGTATAPKPGAASGPAYTIGFEGGLTGAVAADPVSRMDGLKGYFTRLNQSGGIDNHPVNLVARDDTGLDAAKGQANFIEFRDQIKPSMIAGWTVSNVTDAVMPMADQAQIPLLIGTGTEATLAHPYAYLVDTLFSQEAQAEVNFLKTLLKSGDKPKIAIFAATTAAGRTLDAELKKEIAANGWSVVYDEAISYAPPPSDMSPQATKVVKAEADYVLGGNALTTPISFMRSLEQQGWKGKVINFRGGSGLNYLQQINDPNYYVVRSYGYATDPSAKVISDAVTAVGGDPKGDSVAGGWLTAELITRALKKCGYPCSGAQAKKALDSIGLATVADGAGFGQAGFTSSDHAAIHGERLFIFKNGQPTPAGPVVTISTPVQTPAG